jgi:hypothetical protein
MVLLENEADGLLPDFCPLFQVHFMNGALHQVVLTFPGAIKHSKNAKERGFPRSGRPHDGDEFPFSNIRGDTSQDVVSSRPYRIGLLDVSQSYHGVVLISNLVIFPLAD